MEIYNAVEEMDGDDEVCVNPYVYLQSKGTLREGQVVLQNHFSVSKAPSISSVGRGLGSAGDVFGTQDESGRA